MNQSSSTLPTATPRRPALLLAAAAGLCWACGLAMLLSARLETEASVFAPARVIFYVLVLVAALLTFVPPQRRLGIPGLALQGVAGTFLLCYTLAFLPPPTAWLLSLPDVPVYLIFMVALFWTVSALVLPLIYVAGRQLFQQRARQYDLRRSRRQAREFGALAVLVAGLAGLRVLTPLFVFILALVLIVTEMLCLSFIETEQ